MKEHQRVLVAGAAGFVGSHLVDRLLADGYDVVGIDNFCTGQAVNLAHLKGNPRFKFVEHDVREPLQDNAPFAWILHLASPASPPKYLDMPLETLRTNSEGTYQLLELARATGASFLFASTSEIYGDPLVHPQPEHYWGHVNSIGPRSVYDEGKRYGETLTMLYQRTFGVPTRIVRIFNTYGPRMDPDDGRVVSNFINQALSGRPLTVYGDGKQTRSFQYVDDLVEGLRRLMDSGYGEPVNIGNPEEYTMLELAEIICEMVGVKAPIVHEPLPTDDPKQRRPDISRAMQVLGWTPRVPVREGLQRTIAYFRGLAGEKRRKIA